MTNLNHRAAADILAALQMLPETFFEQGDDACDCSFQRVGMWTNPYIAETLEVRMCCIWAELYKLFPQHVRATPAYLDANADAWNPEPRAWDGEDDMPRGLWYRQLSRQTGIPLQDVRQLFGAKEPPAGTPRPQVEEGIPFTDAVVAMLEHLAERVAALEAAR